MSPKGHRRRGICKDMHAQQTTAGSDCSDFLLLALHLLVLEFERAIEGGLQTAQGSLNLVKINIVTTKNRE